MNSCDHCVNSKIPLRCQLSILLTVCAGFFLVLMPAIFETVRDSLGTAFEEEFALKNVNRAMATINKILLQEKDLLLTYSDSDELSDAVDALIEDEESIDDFLDFLSSEFFDYGVWSESSCGNLLAIYYIPEESRYPVHLWSEYHASDPETLEMDLENISPTPSLFLAETAPSQRLLRKMTSGKYESGFIAYDDLVFSVSCQPIIHSETGDEPHGFLCRAVDLHSYLEKIGSGAGACVTMYNMADYASIPNQTLEIFQKLKKGQRTVDGKFNGKHIVGSVTTKDWDAPDSSFRRCGPAELLKANSTTRTLVHLVMESDYTVQSSGGANKSGFGLIFDNARELKPVLDENLIGDLFFLFVFAIVVFIVYGVFTEFGVVRKLNVISEAAYKALVESDNDYYDRSKRSIKEGGRGDGKNEVIHMATLAAQTIEKNMKEYERKKRYLLLEKMYSSVVADQLRLLALYCERTEDDFEAILVKKKKDRKFKRGDDKSFFSADVGHVLGEVITLERILNDPFAVEILKNFSVKNTITHRVTFPARRSVLFLLSALFYRSLSSEVSKGDRLGCLKEIMDEFVLKSPVPGSPTNRVPDDDIVGIPDDICDSMIEKAKKCFEDSEPDERFFDDACMMVREHIKSTVFPQFVRTPAYLVIRAAFAQKSRLQELIHELEIDKVDPSSRRFGLRGSSSSNSRNDFTSYQPQCSARDVENVTEGTQLSHSAFKCLASTLLGPTF